MAVKKTHDQFIQEVFNITHGEYDVLDEYQDSKTKIRFRHNCEVCNNYIFYMTPSKFLSGHGCHFCANIKAGAVHKISHSEFIHRVHELVGEHYTVLEEYTDCETKILMNHNDCGYKYYVTPSNFLRGKRCPNCAPNKKYSESAFKEKVYSIYPDVEIIGKFINVNEKIECICKNDGYVWFPSGASLLSGRKCPRCVGVAKITHDEFVKRMKKINPNITIISEYKNRNEKVEYRCDICGLIWSAFSTNLLKGSGCPECHISNGEKKIMQSLDLLNVSYIWQKKFDELVGVGNGLLSYDFYLPNYNLLIEYQGGFHDGSIKFQTNEGLKRQIEHDNRKKEYAKKHHIEFLEIWYEDFDNIESILNQKLKLIS